jgi:hypothetical protein
MRYHVVYVSTHTSQIGTGPLATQMFKYRAKQLGIKTVAEIAIAPGQVVTNQTTALLKAQIQSAANRDARIWVLLVDDVSPAKNFFVAAQVEYVFIQTQKRQT